MNTLILIVFIFFFASIPFLVYPWQIFQIVQASWEGFSGGIWRYYSIFLSPEVSASISVLFNVLSPSSSFTVNYYNYKLIRLWNLASNFASQQLLVRTNWGVIWQTAQTYKVPALQVISLKSIWLYNLKKNKNKKLKSYHSFHSLHFFSKNRITLTSSTWFAMQNSI